MQHRALPALLALLAGLLLTGCGNGASTAEKTFDGPLSEQDLAAFTDVSEAISTFAGHWTDFAAATSSEDVSGARAAVDGMSDALDDADNAVLEAENTDLSDTLSDYLTTMAKLSSVSDRLIAYYEDDSYVDASVENGLITEFEDAALAARRADRSLMNRILEHASPEQQTEIRARYRKAQLAFKEVTQ